MAVEEQEGPAKGWTWVEAVKPAEPPPQPAVGARAGVPAAGRGSQINPDKSEAGAKAVVDAATTPLLHTGSETLDSLTTPVGLGGLALGGTAIGRAIGAPALSLAERAIAGATAAGGEIAPYVKYDLAQKALKTAGVPSWLAVPAAMMISGYKKGPAAAEAEVAAKAAPAEAAAASRPAVSTGTSMVPAAVPPPQGAAGAPPPAAAAAPAAAPAPAVAAPPPAAGTGPSAAVPAAPFYPQKTLNELAILAKRGNIGQLSGAEYQQGLDLVRKGATPQEALGAIVAQRGNGAVLGAGLPTDAEVAARVAERNRTGRWPK